MAKIPDKAEHQRQFAGLETADRRAIIRAVNRGKAVDQRKLAPLAVGVARRQRKFWRVAWLLGPLVGLTSLFAEADLVASLMNSAVATAALGLMAWFWYSRARRAEALNLELSQSRRDRERRSTVEDDGPSAAQRFRSHLPGGGGSHGGGAGAGTGQRAGSADGTGSPNGSTNGAGSGSSTRPRQAPLATPPPGQRPYRPRGRKRR